MGTGAPLIRFDPNGVGPAPAAAPGGPVTLDPEALKNAASGEGNLSKIAAQRFGEGVATSVPSMVDLILQHGPGSGVIGKAAGAAGYDIPSVGDAAKSVYRNLFGYTEPQGLAEKTVGNVAEMAGGAVIPAGVEATIAKTSSVAALEASHYLRTLAAMPLKDIVKVQAIIAGGAGVGKTIGETLSDNPLVHFATTLAGAFGASGAMQLVKMATAGFKSKFTLAGGETQVGKDLNEVIPAGSQFEKNLNESIALADQTGVKPTLASATQSPTVAAVEGRVAAKIPGMPEKLAETQAASSDTVRGGLAKQLQPPVGESMPAGDLHETLTAGVQKQVDAVNTEAQRLTTEVNGYVEKARTTLEGVVANATRGTATKEEAGGAIRDAVQKAESAWSERMDGLYNGLPDTKLPSTPIADAVKGVMEEAKGSIREGLIPAPIRNLAKRVAPELTEEQKSTLEVIAKQAGMTPEEAMASPKIKPYLEQLGIQATAPDVSFTELRRWRSDIFAEIRANLDGPTPDRQVVRNLSKIADALDATIDQASDVSPAYRAANDAFRQGVETFRQGVVEAVTRVKPTGEQAVALEDIAGKFLKGSGQGQVASARDFVQAVGDSAVARKALRDYAVRDFLGSTYDDGVINSKRAAAWIKSHGDALDQFPEIRTELQGIARQGKTFEDVQGFVEGAQGIIDQNAKRGLSDVEKSAAAAYTKADPAQAMDTVLKSNDPVKRMAELTKVAGADPQAMNGLRRAFFDHMDREVAPNDPMFNNPMMNPKKLRDFIDNNAKVIRVLYTPEHLDNVKTLARATELSMDTAAARGISPETAQKAVSPEQGYSAQQIVARLYTMARWTSWGYVISDFFARKVFHTLNGVEKDQLAAAWERASFDPKAAKAFMEMGKKDFKPEYVQGLIRQAAPVMVNPTGQAMSASPSTQ